MATGTSTKEAKRASPAKLRDYMVASREAGFDAKRARVNTDGSIELVFAECRSSELTPLDRWVAGREES